MAWRAIGLADTAPHVTGFHVTYEMRVQSALDYVASNICKALALGACVRAPRSGCKVPGGGGQPP
jgi:hypothetical protein